MTVPETCDCMYTNSPVTIYVRTNAQSYRIVEVYPYMSNIVAKLMSCHVDYNGKAVDVNKNDIVIIGVDCLRRIRIEDYDNYQGGDQMRKKLKRIALWLNQELAFILIALVVFILSISRLLIIVFSPLLAFVRANEYKLASTTTASWWEAYKAGLVDVCTDLVPIMAYEKNL